MPLLTIPHKAADYDTYRRLDMYLNYHMFDVSGLIGQSLLPENMLELLTAF